MKKIILILVGLFIAGQIFNFGYMQYRKSKIDKALVPYEKDLVLINEIAEVVCKNENILVSEIGELSEDIRNLNLEHPTKEVRLLYHKLLNLKEHIPNEIKMIDDIDNILKAHEKYDTKFIGNFYVQNKDDIQLGIYEYKSLLKNLSKLEEGLTDIDVKSTLNSVFNISLNVFSLDNLFDNQNESVFESISKYTFHLKQNNWRDNANNSYQIYESVFDDDYLGYKEQISKQIQKKVNSSKSECLNNFWTDGFTESIIVFSFGPPQMWTKEETSFFSNCNLQETELMLKLPKNRPVVITDDCSPNGYTCKIEGKNFYASKESFSFGIPDE